MKVAARVRHAGTHLLLFLHGLGCSKESLEGAFGAKELDGYSICTFDFPGHGESSRLDRAFYSLEVFAEVARLVLDRLGYRQVTVVGHSMGGAVALILAPTLGSADVVSVDGNLVGADCGIVSREIADQDAEVFIQQGFEQFIYDLKTSSRSDFEEWGQWCASCDPSALHQSATSLVEWSDSGKLLSIFNTLPRKAYVYGESDSKKYLLPQLRDARIFTVPDASHFMMVDNPSGFYKVVSDTLR